MRSASFSHQSYLHPQHFDGKRIEVEDDLSYFVTMPSADFNIYISRLLFSLLLPLRNSSISATLSLTLSLSVSLFVCSLNLPYFSPCGLANVDQPLPSLLPSLNIGFVCLCLCLWSPIGQHQVICHLTRTGDAQRSTSQYVSSHKILGYRS